MVIKNREERSDAIWKFALLALLCALTVFLLGFNVGNVRLQEDKNLKAQLEKCKADLELVNQNNTAINHYYQIIDSLSNKLKTEIKTLDEELVDIHKSGDISLLEDWDVRKSRLFRNAGTQIITLTDELNEKKVSKEVIGILEILEEFRNAQKRALETKKSNIELSSNKADLEQTGAANDALNSEVTDLKDQIRNLQFDLKVAQTDLKLCNNDLQRAAGGAPKPAEPKCPKAAASILVTTKEIEDSILPDMNVKFLGNNKLKIEKLQQRLRSKVSQINRVASEIE